MRSIIKARSQSALMAKSRKVPSPFVPPYGGSSFYGQAYQWEQVLHYKFWTFIAIRAWMHEIAGGAPPNLGKVTRRQPDAKKRLVKKSLGGPRSHEDFEAYDDDHPLQRLFKNPNGPDVAYDLWAFTILFKKLTGVAHWWVMRNAFGVPVELWVIPTHWVRLRTDREGQPASYWIQSPWGKSITVAYEDVVTFYEHSPLNRYEGFAVSQAIAEWIDVYEAMTRTRLATFKNGAVPAFHVMLDETHGDPDEAFLNRFYARWFARFQGEDRAGRPLITGPGTEVRPLGIAPNEIGFEAGEDQIRDMTLTAFNVPKGVVGLEPTSDVSAYAPQRQFARFAVNPELHYFGQVITEKIVKPVDPEGSCFWDDRVINDPELQLREIETRRGGASITPNEERAAFGDEPFPYGGNDPLLNGSPVPWVTGKGDKELEDVFDSALQTGGDHASSLAETVGGLNAITELQTRFYAGEIPRAAAVATVMQLFKFTEQEAVKLFPDPSVKALDSSSGRFGGYLVNGDQ